MKRHTLALALAFLGSSAWATGWSREGRVVTVQTSEQGRKLAVSYSRLPGEKDVLPALRSCVAQRQGRYASVTCLVFDSPALMNVVSPEGSRVCWAGSARASGSGKVEVLPDNPALQLVQACGGKVRLP